MPTIQRPMYALGLMLQVEITYDVNANDEPEITELWIVGHYPERDWVGNDYVAIGAKACVEAMYDEELDEAYAICRSHHEYVKSQREKNV